MTAMGLSLLVATGCAASTAPAAGPLLPSAGSQSYLLDRAVSHDRQSLGSFAQSTPADPRAVRAQLRQLHARTTASRVWTQPDGEFVLDEAVRFDTPGHAEDFVRWYRSQLLARSAGVFPMPELGSGYAYVTGGIGRTSSSTAVFVEGVIFTNSDQAFLVETGGPNPASLSGAESLARKQAAMTRSPKRESS